jgi:class 3 adenylate cyclase
VTILRYRTPGGDGPAPFALVAGEGSDEQRFPFRDRIEIGRLEVGAPELEGRLLIDDPAVSSRHCVVLRGSDGRLFACDTSRNGTRLDGTRLMPNREQEIRPGQTLSLGPGLTFRLVEEEGARDLDEAVRPASRSTLVQPSSQDLSVVVGDVRGYTSLLGSVPGESLQEAVARAFARLGRTVRSLGGQVKEFQGDSILAFWEPTGGMSTAVSACRAVLELTRDVEAMSADAECWPFRDRPLQMDWAVTTGNVSVQVLGEDRPEELSMVGEAVVLAYRLEKAANDLTGSPLTCERTRAEAAEWFQFRDAGEMALAGFARPIRAFQLLGETGQADGRAKTLEWDSRHAKLSTTVADTRRPPS